MLRTPGRLAVLVFVVLTAIYVVSPVVIYGDGRLTGPTAASIVTSGNLEISEFSDVEWFGGYQTDFRDEGAYDFFPWTRSIFALPIALGLELLAGFGIGSGAGAAVRSDTLEPLLLMVPSALVTAAAAAVSASIAWKLTRDPNKRRTAALAVGFGLGLLTPYWSVASRGAWQHGPAAFWFTLALWAAVTISQEASTRRLSQGVLLGASTTMAVLTRPTFVMLGAAMFVWVVWRIRDRVTAVAIGGLLAAVPVVAVNLSTFGSVLMPYYDIGRSGAARPDPLITGAVGFFLSPSRGVLVFMPLAAVAAVVGLGRSRHLAQWPLAICMSTGAAALLAFVAVSPEGWWAGHTYGPRFVIDVLPVVGLLAVPAVEAFLNNRKAFVAPTVIALGAWSLVVHAEGALVRETGCWNTTPVDVDDDPGRVWDLSDPQFLRGARWVLKGRSPLADSCTL